MLMKNGWTRDTALCISWVITGNVIWLILKQKWRHVSRCTLKVDKSPSLNRLKSKLPATPFWINQYPDPVSNCPPFCNYWSHLVLVDHTKWACCCHGRWSPYLTHMDIYNTLTALVTLFEQDHIGVLVWQL